MCGLVGIFGKNLPVTQEKVFRDLLYLDTLRGEHSTGAAIVSIPLAVNMPEVVEVVKEVGPAPELFAKHGKFQGKYALTNKSQIKALIGHNRFATQGAVTEENAHPFEIGAVVGAHNGTVPKFYLSTLHEASKYEVDSQIIYSHLGAGNSVESVWEVADGAMALTWYDKNTKKLNLIRNKERPLWVSRTKDNKVFYWASEQWMLYIATSRNNIKDIEDPVLMETDKLFEISYDDQGLLVIEARSIPPFVRKPVVSTGYKSGGMWGYGYDDDGWGNYNSKNRVTPLKPTMRIVIKEVVKGQKSYPYAFGENEDGEEVRINFRDQKAAKNQVNNILQRKRSQGVYITEKYYRLHVGGEKPTWVCDYNDLRYFKFVHLAEGFNGVTLTNDEWTKLVKCGCDICQTVPSWKSKDELRWVDEKTFYCGACKDADWVKELEEKYGLSN